jgi:NADPH:quinone reductase-like Zn-dependent oxidoreductase
MRCCVPRRGGPLADSPPPSPATELVRRGLRASPVALISSAHGQVGVTHRLPVRHRLDDSCHQPSVLLLCGSDQESHGANVKAVVYDRYGPPDLLRVEDVPAPAPVPGQVRIKVTATSVNLSDWECLRGSPAHARMGGLRSPARRTLGSDIAGVVDEVGEGTTRFRPGDEVYGDNLALKGGFAEYAVAPESVLAHKPTQLSFAEVSAIPQAGAIALQGTTEASAVSRVLINGAGGGSGSFAIQLAKLHGAHVTGVDNADKQDFMRSVGADEVIDYRRDDFTRTTRPYDLILDLVAHKSVFAYQRALAPGGRYYCVGGSTRTLLRVLTVGSLAGYVTGRSIRVLAVKEGPDHFEPLTDLYISNQIRIHIDRTYTLEEVPAALAHVGEGRARGKVVVTVT